MKLLSIFLTGLLISPGTSFAELQTIGAAGGVNGIVTALAPEAANARRMESGKTVYFKDKVTTGAEGRMQVLLLDQTVFTLGPDTELSLDEFVYNPNTPDANKVTARISKGVFRFVTGNIAKKTPAKMKVKLPVGTIGIRGTIAAGSTDGKTATVALLGPGANNNAGERPGAINVESAGITVEITQPGFGTQIPGPGLPPLPPFKLSNEQLSGLTVKTEAKTGDGSKEPGDEKKSASDASGESTAQATGGLKETSTSGQLTKTFTTLTQDASNDITFGSSSGITQWDEIRAISGGTAFYNASGFTYSCSGGSLCGSGGSGNLAFHFNIDFAGKTIGGSGSSSHVAFESGTLNFLDSHIPATSFSALQGDATLVFGTDFTGTNADFNGTSFSFKNSGKEAHLDLSFTATSISEAQLTGASGATATGTAIATCSSNCPAGFGGGGS